jgi:hypothetical protein
MCVTARRAVRTPPTHQALRELDTIARQRPTNTVRCSLPIARAQYWAKVRQHFLVRTNKKALQKQGANTLARIINSIFSKLITVIRMNGGDVVKFAGAWRRSAAVPSARVLLHSLRACRRCVAGGVARR